MNSTLAGWYAHSKQKDYVHVVLSNGVVLLKFALCGKEARNIPSAPLEHWVEPKGGERCCPHCQDRFEQMQKVKSDEASLPADAIQQHARFLQVVGETIPLCWIPVPDVQAVVKLLLEHLPDSILRLKRAQFQSVITTLNEYVGEALERNAKHGVTGTWLTTENVATGRDNGKEKKL